MAWDFQQCGMCDQQRLRPACAYAQSDQSVCWSLEYTLTLWLLIEHHLEFLSLKGDCTGSSESIHVKMPHCWKSYVAAQIAFISDRTYSAVFSGIFLPGLASCLYSFIYGWVQELFPCEISKVIAVLHSCVGNL